MHIVPRRARKRRESAMRSYDWRSIHEQSYISLLEYIEINTVKADYFYARHCKTQQQMSGAPARHCHAGLTRPVRNHPDSSACRGDPCFPHCHPTSLVITTGFSYIRSSPTLPFNSTPSPSAAPIASAPLRSARPTSVAPVRRLSKNCNGGWGASTHR